jgi:cytochrome b involved in lipid metabolism
MSTFKYLAFQAKISTLPIYAMEEVEQHTKVGDGWIVLRDLFEGITQPLVVDVSKYIKKHPGGMAIMKPYLGTDCTNEFLVYHVEGNSQRYELIMEHTIGVLRN